MKDTTKFPLHNIKIEPPAEPGDLLAGFLARRDVLMPFAGGDHA